MEGRHGVERPTPRLIQNGNGMEERSEEQVISRLFDLENSGQAAQRAELTGERFISLIQDPANGLGYVFQHGLDETEGAEVPEGTEYWEYPTWDEAERAEVRDRYSASDDDPLIEGDDDRVGEQTDQVS